MYIKFPEGVSSSFMLVSNLSIFVTLYVEVHDMNELNSKYKIFHFKMHDVFVIE